MIKNFSCKHTEKVFDRERVQKWNKKIQKIALRKLWMLDAATTINDLSVPPANCLKKLSGNRKHQYSIRINDQYRICFIWRQNDAHDVEITDYH